MNKLMALSVYREITFKLKYKLWYNFFPGEAKLSTAKDFEIQISSADILNNISFKSYRLP